MVNQTILKQFEFQGKVKYAKLFVRWLLCTTMNDF